MYVCRFEKYYIIELTIEEMLLEKPLDACKKRLKQNNNQHLQYLCNVIDLQLKLIIILFFFYK